MNNEPKHSDREAFEKHSCGVWMMADKVCISVKREISVRIMKALKLDASDWRLRDKAIAALSPIFDQFVEAVEWQASRASKPEGVDVKHVAFDGATKVREALDRRACPDAFMCIAFEESERQILASLAHPAPQDVGLPVSQEPKYTTNGTHIVNRASGEVIPHDEPVFIFRARDKKARIALLHYAMSLPEGGHLEAVKKRLSQFVDFTCVHPERMKEPDTAPFQQATGGGDE